MTEFSPGRMMAFKAASKGIVYDGRVLVEPWKEGSNLPSRGTSNRAASPKLIYSLLKRRLEGGIKKEVASIKEFVERS